MKHAMVAVPRVGTGTNADPYRCPLEVSWQDVTGQPVPQIIAGQQAYTVEVLCEDAELAAIRADGRYAVLWDVDADDLEAVPVVDTTDLTNLYYADVPAYIETQSEPVAALIECQLRPPWQVGLSVAAGEVYAYGDNLYQVIQAHTTQSDWTPNIVPALFKRFYEPTDDPWPWVQPVGGHDAYPLGARVLHGGYTWQSLIDANVWEPGSVGAENLWENLTPPPATPEWAAGVSYQAGDIVIYQGNEYRCLQAHTAISTWNPVATLNVLWVRL